MFLGRINGIRSSLKREKLDAVLISSVSNITYLSGYNNFSESEREAYILIGEDFGYIITDARYSEAVKKQVPHLKLFERSHQNPTDKLFKELIKKIKTLGIEEDNLTVAEHKTVKKHFKKLKHFEADKLRSIKEKWEIEKIKKSCKLGDLAFGQILGKIKVGAVEKQIAWELEKFIKDKGAEFSFPAIVAFGKNSSVPHHQTGNTRLTGKDKFILLDFGVKYDNYCSDMTRTVFLGKPSAKQKKIYETVLKAQTVAVDYINSSMKTGKEIKAAEVDEVAREYITTPEVSGLQLRELQVYPTIPHSLGHGVGLEVHEHPSLSPKSRDILKEGMVFSIEPGIYIPGYGGVRIEDLFVLEKNGLKQLTRSPKKLFIVKPEIV